MLHKIHSENYQACPTEERSFKVLSNAHLLFLNSPESKNSLSCSSKVLMYYNPFYFSISAEMYSVFNLGLYQYIKRFHRSQTFGKSGLQLVQSLLLQDIVRVFPQSHRALQWKWHADVPDQTST